MLVTTVVGSYPQPDWLIDRERLGDRLPPRVRARELWRVPEPFLEEAQDDATRLAVQDMERAGVDVITDGEMRRESYSNRFATALDGVDLDNPGVALDRTGHENPVPRVVGPIRRTRAGRGPRRRVPALAHGPPDQDHRARAVHDDAAGAERPLRRRPQPGARVRRGRQRGAARPQGGRAPTSSRSTSRTCRPAREPAREYAVEAIDRALDGHRGRHGPAHLLRLRAHRPRPAERLPVPARAERLRATQISLEAAQPNLDPEVLRALPDKTIVLGVLDLGSEEVETPELVAERIRRALTVVRRSGSSSRRTAA